MTFETIGGIFGNTCLSNYEFLGWSAIWFLTGMLALGILLRAYKSVRNAFRLKLEDGT